MRIKVALATVTAGLAVAGAACTHDPDPSPTLTGQPTSTAPTATPRTTPPPPPLPSTAQADSPAGAESFARYYMALLDYAYQTGNTSPVRGVARCKGCDAVADGIDSWYRQGGHYEGGHFTVKQTSTIRYASGRESTVSLTYLRSTRELVSATGTHETVQGEDDLKLALSIRRVANRWTITNIQPIQ